LRLWFRDAVRGSESRQKATVTGHPVGPSERRAEAIPQRFNRRNLATRQADLYTVPSVPILSLGPLSTQPGR
jgi:hypothetical protein